MSTATPVPETTTISATSSPPTTRSPRWRRYGRWNLVKTSFLRFRYADGFTNARAAPPPTGVLVAGDRVRRLADVVAAVDWPARADVVKSASFGTT